jgi:short-subunit dehydrogenase
LLSQEGYAVTAVARNEARLKDLAAQVPGLKYISADLTTGDGINEVARILREGKFNLLVNNAGIGIFGPFHTMPADANQRMMGLNCTAVVDLSSAFLSVAEKGDALINVSSGASYLPLPWSSLYTGTKGFVTAFTEALWYEQRRRGIYVLALCPGGTYSKFHARAGGKESQLVPLFMQTPEHVAGVALKHLKRRRQPVVICGAQKPLIVLSRFFPRKWVVLASSWLTEGSEKAP